MIKYEKYNFNCDQREIFGIDLLLFSELFLSLAIIKCITRWLYVFPYRTWPCLVVQEHVMSFGPMTGLHFVYFMYCHSTKSLSLGNIRGLRSILNTECIKWEKIWDDFDLHSSKLSVSVHVIVKKTSFVFRTPSLSNIGGLISIFRSKHKNRMEKKCPGYKRFFFVIKSKFFSTYT